MAPDTRSGLTTAEARLRLKEYGPNRLVSRVRRPTLLTWIVRPFSDPMVLLLLLAGVAYVLLRDYVNATIVLISIVPIALTSIVLEARAERALEGLRRLTAPTARVQRDGELRIIPTEEVVPGEILYLQEGDVIPADGILVEGTELSVDESPLTGESQPVVKTANGPVHERGLFAGTTVLSGRGVMDVTVTGPETRFGKVGTLVAGIRPRATPLQRVIQRLIWQSTVVAAGFCAAVMLIELGYGHGWAAAISAGVSLAIVAMPEEFSIVYTLYLSIGAARLARAHALVRRLASVETLGATTVICTDKTGTLTLGRMDVAELVSGADASLASEPLGNPACQVLEAALLASEPRPFDPLEQALFRFAEPRGWSAESFQGGELLADYPFDPVLKYLSHVWRWKGETVICAKGSIEGILERSQVTSDERRRALEANGRLASRGLRVIAVAAGRLDRSSGDRRADECDLSFLGLIGFSDPLRPGVTEALRQCGQAGIRVIMITGDHPVTAHAVAEGLGLPHDDHVATGDELDTACARELEQLAREVNIFARIRPEQKYLLVGTLRTQGQIVAMTGDGINDAPALRAADIGIAMGQRGTEVAREAADLVLLDDNFATIVGAVHDGRRIFENLRRAFSYLVAFQVPLLLAALVIPLIGVPLLLLPAQMILAELIIHPTSSLVYENDPPPPDLMRRPPRRPGAGLLMSSDVIRSLAQGVSLFSGVLVLYLLGLSYGVPVEQARGTAYAALFIGQIVMVLAERSPTEPIWRMGLTENPVLPAVLIATIGILIAVFYVPPLASLLRIAPLSLDQWGLAAGVAATTTLWLEPLKALQRPGVAPPV